MIVSLIEGYGITLKRVGREYSGLCPFHSERTPSFFANDDKDVFYCFGCGQGGTAEKFFLMMEGEEWEARPRIDTSPGFSEWLAKLSQEEIDRIQKRSR